VSCVKNLLTDPSIFPCEKDPFKLSFIRRLDWEYALSMMHKNKIKNNLNGLL
tara:strand:- start:343 stop:498 length:156 start_codon:yes stop_codon:yes gene_type:complete